MERRPRTNLAVLLFAVVLLVAGVGSPVLAATNSSSTASPPGTSVGATTGPAGHAALGGRAGGQPSPVRALHANSSVARNSTIGYFDGYWYDSPIHVTQRDGLNRSERRAYVDRTIARDEVITHRNFKRDVPVSVVSRATYRKQANVTRGAGSRTYQQWNSDVWRAAFIVGEKHNLSKTMGNYYGAHVLGFYAPKKNDITLVVPNGSVATIDHGTLAHELTHALQDQYFNISREKYAGRTQDQQLAVKGLLEGQADYVKAVYDKQCNTGQWSCVGSPSSGNGGSGSNANGGSAGSPNYGVQWVLYFPYAKGPSYVHALQKRGGWSAVYRAFRHPPTASTDIIHHENVSVPPLSVNDTARNGWQRYRGVGANGTDTLGEATIYAMFWWQSYHSHAGVLDPHSIFQKKGPYDQFNYTSAPSAGWYGDVVAPYHKAGAKTDGYVWVTRWRSKTDANQFLSAYTKVLHANGATQTGADTWSIGDGNSFAGTYRVVQRGTKVLVVEGPTHQAVTNIRPGLANGTAAANGSAGGSSSAASSSPGFGVVGTLLALALLVVVVLGRQR